MKSILGISAVVALAGQALAVVNPFVEDFAYPNGSLTSVSGGNWVTHSGTAGQVQVSGGAISLVQGAQSEDVNRNWGGGLGAGETVFFGFDVTMSGGATISDGYFAHVKDSGNFFSARVFVTDPASGGDYTYGFSASGNLADGGTWASDFTYGSTQRVIASYNYDSGEISMWINANADTDPHLTFTGFAGDEMEAVAFREFSGGNTTQVIDNLRVGTSFASVVPTPGAAALVGFAGLAATRRRRSV